MYHINHTLELVVFAQKYRDICCTSDELGVQRIPDQYLLQDLVIMDPLNKRLLGDGGS